MREVFYKGGQGREKEGRTWKREDKEEGEEGAETGLHLKHKTRELGQKITS
jgi:hypothetical protein